MLVAVVADRFPHQEQAAQAEQAAAAMEATQAQHQHRGLQTQAVVVVEMKEITQVQQAALASSS
jgi:hypothetical protein